MKNIIIVILAVLFINPVFSQTMNQEAEVKLIMKILEKETDCFFNKDINCYSSHWSNSNLAFLTNNNSDGSIHTAQGYDEIISGTQDYFENNPPNKNLKGRRNVIRQNIEYEFYNPTTAYLMWDQYNENRISKTYTYSSETRLMKKEDGEWKIFNVTALWDYSYWVEKDALEKNGKVVILDKQKMKDKKEVSSIKQVLNDETKAYYDRDYEGWASNWIQDETISNTWNNKNGSYTSIEGWKSLSDRFSTDMKENPEIIYPNFYVSDMTISISGNHAIVKHDEFVANKNGDMYTKAKGLKTLLKVDGMWKLESVSSFWDYDYKYSKEKVEKMIND